MWTPLLDPDGIISRGFGPLLTKSEVFDFSTRYTPYYEPEMGQGLQKAFFVIQGLHSGASLTEWKRKSLLVEGEHRAAHGRTLNLDPLLLSLNNVIIATTKNAPHRVPIAEGLWGDLALVRRSGKWEGMPWTYRDYVDFIPFFEEVRKALKEASSP